MKKIALGIGAMTSVGAVQLPSTDTSTLKSLASKVEKKLV
jgi:hypothetical protein